MILNKNSSEYVKNKEYKKMNLVYRLFVLCGVIFLVVIYFSDEISEKKLQMQYSFFIDDYKKYANNKLGFDSVFLDEVFKNSSGIYGLYRKVETKRKNDILNANNIDILLNADIVKKGQEFIKNHIEELQMIEKKYKVDSSILVAFLGLQSLYCSLNKEEFSDINNNINSFDEISVLSTLALGGEYSDEFKKELDEYIGLLKNNNVNLDQFGDSEGRFSCLGFSPAEYSRYGVDENLDGIVDLSKNYMDILASASNYLIKMGWKDYNSWGFVVSLPMNVDDVSENLQLINFKKIGFKQYNGDSLPDSKDVYTLINTNFNGRLALLVNSNFYNLVGDGKSLSYTVSLAFLSKELNDFIKYYKALDYSKKIDEKDKRINTVEPVKEELYRNYYKKRQINDAK